MGRGYEPGARRDSIRDRDMAGEDTGDELVPGGDDDDHTDNKDSRGQ
jgi:hypothetical protein